MVNLFLFIALLIGIAIGFQLCFYVVSIGISKLITVKNSGIVYNEKENSLTIYIDKVNKESILKLELFENK